MGNMKQSVIVLSAQQYRMPDEQTGEISEGTSVRCIYADSLVPVVDGQLKGYKVAKAIEDYNNFSNFVEVPGVYEADVNLKIDSKGQTKVSLSNFVFKKSFAPSAK